MTHDVGRRGLLAGLATGSVILAAPVHGADRRAAVAAIPEALPAGVTDRAFALSLLQRMAEPLLGRMANGRLHADWTPELSPTWDGRNPGVAYLEGFGRLIDGIAPWLALPVDGTEEGRLRARLIAQAQASYAHAVDPRSPDYLLWHAESQPLVDSAYFSSALLRAPDVLWTPLDAATKSRIVAELKGLRRIAPPYQNWLLFAAMNEAFLFSVGEQWDPMRVEFALRKFQEWYVGDGWYGDGPRFHFDHYNSYVIHPMLTQILGVLAAGGARFNALRPADELSVQIRRMQRFGEHLERMIGPDGAFPPIGRSSTYRTAVHQPLAYLAWKGLLPASLSPGRVRAATMAAQRRIFRDPTNFDARGFLTIGFARHQPTLGDVYSNAGSMYITSESLLALGMPAGHAYWTDAPESWTMRDAYGGRDFRKDYYAD